MIDNILYTSANIAGLGTSSTSRSGSSSTSRSSTTSATNGKTPYTLPDGKSYSLTKDQFDEFHNVYDKAYGIAYSMKSAAPRVSDVLKYGYAVLDSYERGIVFNESDFLAMMGAKQQQHEQQTNTSAAVSNPNDFETLTLPDHTTVTVPKSEAKALKEFMQIYDLCMEYAYPNLAQPKWSDVVKYGNVVLDWYREGIPFDAAEYERRVMAGESELTTTPPEVKIPDNVVPPVTVAPSEEKGSSLLVPGIILALGVIGAIALTSKSKKRR